MCLLKLIRNRASIRKYTSRRISRRILSKILEAGMWGPSVFGRQPYKFLIVRDKKVFSQIVSLLGKKSKRLDIGGRTLMNSSRNTIMGADILIFVYITSEIVSLAKKFDKRYSKIAKNAEVQSAAAAIQNLILTAESCGVGSCWFDVPVIFKKSISKILKDKNELIAVITLGYPVLRGKKRSLRKKKEDFVENFRISL